MMPYLIHSILTQKQFALPNYQPACRSGRLLITKLSLSTKPRRQLQLYSHSLFQTSILCLLGAYHKWNHFFDCYCVTDLFVSQKVNHLEPTLEALFKYLPAGRPGDLLVLIFIIKQSTIWPFTPIQLRSTPIKSGSNRCQISVNRGLTI